LEEEKGVRLSAEERRVLLEDIGRVALMLGREQANLLSARPAGSAESAATPLERLRLLERLWPQIETALHGVVVCLDSRVRSASVSVPLARSRGGPGVAAEIARRPRPLTAWLATRQDDTHRDETARVTEARPVVSVNTPANRLVVTLLADLEREAHALATLADFCEEPDEAERARRVATAVRRGRGHHALHGLTPLSEAERAVLSESEVLLRCPPPYRTLFSLCRLLHPPLGLDWSDAALLRLPQRAPWLLYEIWCFLRVAACLRASGWRPVEGDSVRVTPNGLRLALTTGRASRLRFTREGASLELFYQPLFVSANQVEGKNRVSGIGYRVSGKPDLQYSGISIGIQNPTPDTRHPTPGLFVSRTHAMQPDIALLREGEFYLLDAKYRVYAPPGEVDSFGHQDDALLDDVDKMHAYRDSIVGAAQAWCLFPGSPDEARDIVAYPQSSSVQPFGTAGIGAIRLRPGCNAVVLERLLRSWVEG
jgi:hypothetical protein